MQSPIHTPDLGPTGAFPDGKIADNDQGETRVAVGHYEGQVFLDFGTIYVALAPGQALEVAARLQREAHKANGTRTQ